MHCPPWHLSLLAQASSERQDTIQMPSTQAWPAGQVASLTQVLGMRTHSTSALPVKEGGQEQRLAWRETLQMALMPQAVPGPPAQGSLQRLFSHTWLDLQFESTKQESKKENG